MIPPIDAKVGAPTFSIVIPVFNRTQKLLRAVKSCLDQDYPHWELVIIDDGSVEPVANVLSDTHDSRIRCLRLIHNQGVSAARNHGITHARGRYIAFLDSDDIFEQEKLSICNVYLQAQSYPEDICMGSRIYIRRAEGRRASIPANLIEPGEDVLSYIFTRGGILSTDTLVISSELARTASFRTDLSRHEDYDFMLRLQSNGARFHMLKDSLATWYDEEDPNRLTRTTGYEQSRYWIESVASDIDPSTYSAFQIRVLGPLAAKEANLRGLRIFCRHVLAAKGMPWSSRLVCLLKCTAPGAYLTLTSLYIKLQSNTNDR